MGVGCVMPLCDSINPNIGQYYITRVFATCDDEWIIKMLALLKLICLLNRLIISHHCKWKFKHHLPNDLLHIFLFCFLSTLMISLFRERNNATESWPCKKLPSSINPSLTPPFFPLPSNPPSLPGYAKTSSSLSSLPHFLTSPLFLNSWRFEKLPPSFLSYEFENAISTWPCEEKLPRARNSRTL